MRIYLDMCCLQRPFDDLSQPRVRIEAEAVLEIIALCESGGAELVSSFALEFENGRNPHRPNQARTRRVLGKAGRFVDHSPEVEDRALDYQRAGLKPLDANHLACAVEADADYFCTCDDRFRKRSQILLDGPPKIVTPVELIEEIGP